MSQVNMPLSAVSLSFRTTPPRAERLCRLLPLLADEGVRQLVVDWEESFPWSIDARMVGPGGFNEKEIEGVCSVAARARMSLIPRLARHGLPRVLDRVPSFTVLAGIATDQGQLEAYAAAALRMVERVVDDILGIVGSVPQLALGGVGRTAHHSVSHAYRRQFLTPVETLLRSRGIEPLLEPSREPLEAQPFEWSIASAMGLSETTDSALGRAVAPVVASIKQLDHFLEGAWLTLRTAAAGLHAASRHSGSRADFLSDDVLHAALSRLGSECARLRAELSGVLGPTMEAEVLAGYLARSLAPVEELAAATLARARALR